MSTKANPKKSRAPSGHDAVLRPGRRAAGPARITAALGLCLLRAPLLRLGHERPAMRLPARAPTPPLPLPPRTPFDAALHEAVHHWARALDGTDRERYQIESWDPGAARGIDADAWRRQLMARGRSDDLRQARIAARCAVSLATTPEETYQATLWLSAFEHDSGHHAAELQQARRLVALAPHSEVALLRLRRAARCNGLQALARQADKALAALPHTPHAGNPSPPPPGFAGGGQP